jgi:hypothetical protein
MILEGIVTTLNDDGSVNIAPMGPRVDATMSRFLLRPFRTAQTYRNLKRHGEGVLHVTDDVWLLARAALGPVEPAPALIAANQVQGFVLADACRAYEFRVLSFDESGERVGIAAEVVHSERFRDFFGLSRAKHAILEAAILATRTDFLPLAEIDAEFHELAILVDKTGGEQERQALAFLRAHLDKVMQARGHVS